MNDSRQRADTLNPRKNFIGGEQRQHWVEFQLLGEREERLANSPYQTLSDAIREGSSLECSGHGGS